jgi:predicted HTH transcriptional regulator
MKYSEKESSTVEWKREIPKNDQIIKTIIGFCNHHGGKIVIGVANTGDVVGVDSKKIEKALESLEKTIYEACYPSIIPRIYTQRFEEKIILIIEVSSGMSKPYYRKSKGLDRGCYIRLGRSTMKATADIIEELRWQANGIDFETLPNHLATKKDLDEKKIQFFLDHRKNHAKSTVNDPMLRAYHLLVLEHSKFFPTQAALLIFGLFVLIFKEQPEGIQLQKSIVKVLCLINLNRLMLLLPVVCILLLKFENPKELKNWKFLK